MLISITLLEFESLDFCHLLDPIWSISTQTNYQQKMNNKKNNFMTPFYGWVSTASRLEPLRGGNLLFTTKFPEIPGTHFIDLGRMKG